MYCAMADLAYEYKDKELLDACKTLWEDMTKRQMYITGSIGASLNNIYEEGMDVKDALKQSQETLENEFGDK